MNHIKIITDKDFNIKPTKLKKAITRYAARGIVIRDDGKIAILNKIVKQEYKLPGGGVEENESIEETFKREILEETGCYVEITDMLGSIKEIKKLENFVQISYIFVGKVIKNTNKLKLTQKEKDEGGQLLWVTIEEALNLISNCYNVLKASKYESLYHSRFIVLRDKYILEYYLKQK